MQNVKTRSKPEDSDRAYKSDVAGVVTAISAFFQRLSILSHHFDLSEASRRDSVACRLSLRVPQCAWFSKYSDGARLRRLLCQSVTLLRAVPATPGGTSPP
ncbi:hypothetical protein EMIT0324P_90212 [Pseudomonas chlororaphis]